ncbi:MAG: PhzF family phenazine biosynthesis protein [Polaribacter sp.]|nr:PhzF family phenazine biosynthesis protein [Polaribacter sp.]MDG1953952.1 PhzF family phenazine biosynthesis protein [Polaribacter sp.]
MRINIYQIDAFTDQLFGGNPAAVCPLVDWLDDEILQNIAIENNLAETAFFVQSSENRFHLRWFTPEFEMDLCGHATLASAFVIIEELGNKYNEVLFDTQSGLLTVKKIGDYYELDFPSRPPKKSSLPKIIRNGLNIQPKEIWKARDYLLVYDTEDDIEGIKPNIAILNQINIDPGGIIVTSKGKSENVDFVSRLFTPQATVFEDPVTGSAHCTLVPFWADRINKTELRALQISKRGGELLCQLNKDRVLIKGKAVKYLEGTIEL